MPFSNQNQKYAYKKMHQQQIPRLVKYLRRIVLKQNFFWYVDKPAQEYHYYFSYRLKEHM